MYLRGQCFCSSVQFEIVQMKALAQTLCHCESCRRSHSTASLACMTFPIKLEDGKSADSEGKLRIVKGEDKLKLYHHTPNSYSRRYLCKECGAHVFNSIPGMGMVTTFPTVFGGAVDFKPDFHVNYGEKIFAVRDGLPKYKGFMGSERLDDDGQPIAV
ncbi:hypothetical protein KFL_000170120 [Klebsormidium nitens]|uniref:CENP-V/GFA domain-containing protein n=1 Tax=Klebsormidium nitens TaxID=105231 RepID=A0A1Y1HPY3_KLENI|nr:hypothetical protein KFL_000170120 [Klebsormidium nitens]|eukprot:GAQ78666.1 hypothetical protein KFL_000170120 [Klebsormidium nitens]